MAIKVTMSDLCKRVAFAVSARFSNRPFGVKHFQTIRRCSVDVAHGLALLFGIGTKALVWGFLVKRFKCLVRSE